MRKIVMPRMDMDMEEGTVVEWLKTEGKEVSKDEPIVKIMSLKVTYEIPSTVDGILHAIIVPAASEASVGQVLGIISEQGDSVGSLNTAVEAEMNRRMPIAGQVSISSVKQVQEPLAETRPRIVASPVARRLAEEKNLDLSSVKGTGPDGRITREDVMRTLEQSERSTATEHLSGIRKTVAERMAESWTTAPHAFLMIEVSASNLIASKKKFQEQGIATSTNSYFVWAAAKALQEHGILNSTLNGSEIRTWKEVNVCLAIDTEQGLVAPVIKRADRKTPEDLTREIEELIAKARQNKLDAADFKDGTFTITNLGMYGVKMFQPIINPPQAAILAVGSILSQPVARNGEIQIEPVVTLSLAFDHRIVDGVPAAKYLSRVKELLESV